MKLKDYKKTVSGTPRKSSLCFLVKDHKVLLAMKKRGFGVGKFNGIGGKKDAEETIEDAARREIREEICVTVQNLISVATIDTFFPHNPDWGQRVTVFLVYKWNGKPVETEEMAPRWFNKKAIPFKQMWPDEKYWLPLVLEGKNVEAEFMFGKDESIIDYKISIL